MLITFPPQPDMAIPWKMYDKCYPELFSYITRVGSGVITSPRA